MKPVSAIAAVVALLSFAAQAADYPAPKEGQWVARDFRFHTGEVLPEVRLSYTTVGEPSGQPVLMLHGTTGSARSMLTPAFAGELFGAGQPLDATKYYVIIPDALGHGKSAKPSDGLRAKFPKYNYDDMVDAQHRLLTEGLGIRHVRLIIGNSMGGMHAWIWGVKYPGYMDALVPMAAQPTEMSARNWMLRRLLIESVRNDPDYNGGNYTTQPKAMKVANTFFAVATAGGTLAWQKLAPTRAQADKMMDERLAAPFSADANDYIYQWESSSDYNPAPGLEKISAALLAVNAADDERNPPETGVMERAMKRVTNGSLLLIPASEDSRGHATTGAAKVFAKELGAFLDTAPKRAM
jgi:homoserine O-acetyltransferase